MTLRMAGLAVLVVAIALTTGCSGGLGPTYPSPHTVSIEGRITDAITGEGVQGVRVTIGEQSDVTDGQGRYCLVNVEPGTHAIQIEPPEGYTLAGSLSDVAIDEGYIELGRIYLAPDVEEPPAPPAPPAAP